MNLPEKLKNQELIYKEKTVKIDFLFNILSCEENKKIEQRMNLKQYKKFIQHAYVAEVINKGITLSAEDFIKLDQEKQAQYVMYMRKKGQNALKELKTPLGYRNVIWYIKSHEHENKISEDGLESKEYAEILQNIYTIRGVNYMELLGIKVQQKMPMTRQSYNENTEKKEDIKEITEIIKWEKDTLNIIKKSRDENLKTVSDSEKHQNESVENDKNTIDFIANITEPEKTFEEQKEVVEIKQSYHPIISSFKIPLEQISQSYDEEQLKKLCRSSQQWSKGQNCNTSEYSYAAEVTGIPEEIIAYAYEVNRKNFPQQVAEERKVKNGTNLSDLEIAKSIMTILAKYDIEKNSFFILRETPRQLTLANAIQEKLKNLQSIRDMHRKRSLSLTKMMEEVYGVDKLNKKP